MQERLYTHGKCGTQVAKAQEALTERVCAGAAASIAYRPSKAPVHLAVNKGRLCALRRKAHA